MGLLDFFKKELRGQCSNSCANLATLRCPKCRTECCEDCMNEWLVAPQIKNITSIPRDNHYHRLPAGKRRSIEKQLREGLAGRFFEAEAAIIEGKGICRECWVQGETVLVKSLF